MVLASMPKGEIVGIEALLLALMAIRVLEACLMMIHKLAMMMVHE